ncbi:MAG: ABC transporter permease [Polyangiaceae bacterium]|nr:ABC transporter permease [Myxococcales bacterium]MCB9589868.1 ABC transporter permease [Polyangiaceae bacterium]
MTNEAPPEKAEDPAEPPVRKRAVQLIGSPLPRVRQVILGVIPILILCLLYAYYSHQRHVENPMDRLMPGLDQLTEGLKEITTPNKRTDEVWLWVDTKASLLRLFKGMGAGLGIAISLGLLMGIFSHVRAIFAPLMTALAKVPPLALLPIIFIFLGVDESSKIVLIALGIAPTLTNDIALAGRGVPQSAVVKAYTLGASTTEVAFKVIFPQILPRILDSIRLTIGPAWIFLIASEAISADSGLGYRIYVVQRQLAMNVILPYVLWIALLGVVMDYIIAGISRWGFPWAHDRGGH